MFQKMKNLFQPLLRDVAFLDIGRLRKPHMIWHELAKSEDSQSVIVTSFALVPFMEGIPAV